MGSVVLYLAGTKGLGTGDGSFGGDRGDPPGMVHGLGVPIINPVNGLGVEGSEQLPR